MWTTETPRPPFDPDDTLPPGVPDESVEPPRKLPERGQGWRVDGAARELARLCAGWAHRGRSLEDLVGLVRGCWCAPTVIPRAELASRFPRGRTLEALRAIRAEPGRLAVVEASCEPDEREEEQSYREHHIFVPQVDTPDTRGLLAPLPTEWRKRLDRWIAERLPRLTPSLAKELYDNRTPDALYLKLWMLEPGGDCLLNRRCYALPKEKPLLDAAGYEARPGKLLCLGMKQFVWQHDAATWIDLEQLGLRLKADPCHERSRLYDVFMPPEQSGDS